jgi:hypothetical protein
MAAGDIVVVRENASSKKGNYFDGTDDYVLHDAHAVARVAANDTVGTYTAWIYKNELTTNQSIISAGDNNNANEFLKFAVTGDGKLRCLLKHGGATQWDVAQTTASITAKTWTHVAVVQNGTQPALYINGVNVVVTNSVFTDLTMWYDELTLTDKSAIGVLESNNTHTEDWKGAIGQVKYWNKALEDWEIKLDYEGTALTDDGTYLQLNVTMENDGTTDSGLGADNGTLTGHAYYGGEISNWSYKLNANSSGHAAEFINTFRDNSDYVSIIKKGD